MRVLLGLMLASTCCVASAEDPKTAAAIALVELIQVDEVYGSLKGECVAAFDAPTQAKAAYNAHHGDFGGISPCSAYWPDVVALFYQFREDSCAEDVGAVKRAYVQKYVERLSLPELQAALAYMRSPVGRAVQAATRDAGSAVAKLQLQEQQKIFASASERYTARLAELVARYKARPR